MPSPPPSVLLVEDDRPFCDLLAELLLEAGYRVVCARDGEEAWAEVLRGPPDVVLSDIQMPRLDGMGLASRLAAHGYGIPIIVMSAGHPRWAGARVTFLRKPVDLDHLLATLAAVLSPPSAHPTQGTA